MSRTKTFFSGALFTYLYQGGAMLVGIWLTPFYVHTLGPKDFGVWLIGLQVLTLLLLIDFGIMGVMPRDVGNAAGLEASNPGSDQLSLLIGRTLKIVLAQTVFVAIASAAVFLYRPVANAGLRGPIALILFVFTISYPLRLFPAILQGLQDLKFLGQVRLTLWALSTLLTVVLLLLGARFYALAWGWCFQQMGHDLVAAIRLRRLRPEILTADTWRKAGQIRWRWFGRGFWVSVGQGAYTLLAGSDLLIVARVLGPAMVVTYTCTAKLANVVQNQPQILAGMALPGLSNMRTSESRDRILSATTSLTQAILLLAGAVFCVVLSVNREFVTLWMGPSFFGGVQLSALMALNVLVRQIDYTLAIALFALGYERLSAIRCLLDGLTGVTLAFLLAPRMGLPGITLAYVASAVLVAIPIDLYFVAREFQISFFQSVQPYTPYLWRFAVIAAAGYAIMIPLGASGFWGLAFGGVLVLLAYAALVIPYVWKTPLREYIEAVAMSVRNATRSRLLSLSNNT